MFDLSGINWWAVLLAAFSSFMLGGLWYSPLMFFNSWNQEENMKARVDARGRHPAIVYGISFLLSVIAAGALAGFLGQAPDLIISLRNSLIFGLAFVAAAFGINYLFSGHSFKFFLVNAGYHVIQFLIFGIILGLWH